MTVLVEATATKVEINDAKFSTDYRYIRERSTGAYAIVAGATCGANVQTAGHNGDVSTRPSIYWRYVCGSYSIVKSRPATWQNNLGNFVAQSLTAPTVTGTASLVDAP